MNISALLQGLASFAWIGFIGVLVTLFLRVSRNQPAKGLSSLVIILLVVAVVLTATGAGVVFIEPDDMAVVVTVIGGGGIRPEP